VSPNDDSFPSWAPRWDQLVRTLVLSNSFSANTWRTSRNTEPYITFSDNSDSILVGSFHFDLVKDIDDNLAQIYHPMLKMTERISSKPEDFRSAFKELWEQKGSKCTTYTYGEQRECAFAATLTAGADTGFPSFQGEPFNHLDFRAAYYSIDHTPNAEQKPAVPGISDLDTELEKLSFGKQELSLEAASVNLGQDSSKTNPLPGLVRAIDQATSTDGYRCEFHFSLQRCNETGRQFFTTEKGYMGFGPPTLQPGDDICVFFLCGEIAPFALQKGEEESSSSRENTTYRLGGECYLHGIMRGEAMEELQAGTLKEEAFDIR
jgi:hypothetical protein